jgi:hypothetical protein
MVHLSGASTPLCFSSLESLEGKVEAVVPATTEPYLLYSTSVLRLFTFLKGLGR